MSEHDDALEHDELAPEPFMANMLAAYREEQDMPSDAKARVQRRLESAPAVGAADTAATSSRGLWIGAAVVAVVAAILVVPRLGDDEATQPAGVAESPVDEPMPRAPSANPPMERDTSVAPPTPEVETPEPVAEPDGQQAADEDAGEDTQAHDRSRAKARRKAATPSARPEAPAEDLSPADSLAAETALLRRAQTALSSGKPRSAFSILREHAQRFPEGVLAEERRALEVVALCDDGQVERGSERASAFLAKHPGSALRERVAAACPEASK